MCMCDFENSIPCPGQNQWSYIKLVSLNSLFITFIDLYESKFICSIALDV